MVAGSLGLGYTFRSFLAWPCSMTGWCSIHDASGSEQPFMRNHTLNAGTTKMQTSATLQGSALHGPPIHHSMQISTVAMPPVLHKVLGVATLANPAASRAVTLQMGPLATRGRHALRAQRMRARCVWQIPAPAHRPVKLVAKLMWVPPAEGQVWPGS